MNQTTRIKAVFASMFLALCLVSTAAVQGSGLPEASCSDPPAWVAPVPWDREASADDTPNEEGVRYLLVDRQTHAFRVEHYTHIVMQMLNEQGVQDNGDLTIGFDPSYQTLTIHQVQLHRQGRIIDQLDPDAVQLIQPERDLPRSIYSGDHQALLILNDLRSGDVLEYAFTVRGANPVYAGHYWTQFYIQTDRPIHEQHIRIVWFHDRPITLRSYLSDWAPVRRTYPDRVEYQWDIPALPSLRCEDCLPSTIDPVPFVEVSDFESWQQVVDWAVPLYPAARHQLSDEMRQLISGWKETHQETDALALAALRFVQNDLRYFGIEFGPNSHRPSRPDLTFERRFGDCKDKSYLLCTLLQALDIEAWPVLVNSSLRGAVGDRLPSPFAFNHVIVKILLPGGTAWVDPTRSFQGGSIWTSDLPDYGQGLPVRAGTRTLEPIVRADHPAAKQTVHQVFTVEDYERPVEFTVSTLFTGREADTMRATLAESDRTKLSTDYLNFYARFYPGISSSKSLVVKDDLQANVLRIIEEYEIRDFWELSEAKNQWIAWLHPDGVSDLLTDPNARLRTMPLDIPYPLHRSHITTVHLPEAFEVDDWSESVEHDAFRLDYRRNGLGKTIQFEYELSTLAGEVSPDQVPLYLSQLEEADSLLGDYLERPRTGFFFSLSALNWNMVLLTIVYSLLLLGGCIWLARNPRFRPDPSPAPPEPPNPELVGLRGWLILVGFRLCLSPLLLLFNLAGSFDGFFSNAVWQEVAMPQGASYHVLYGPLLMTELVFNITFLGLAILQLYLFFARRRLFPILFIIDILLCIMFLVLDLAISQQIPDLATGDLLSDLVDIAKLVISACIWIPYMLVSRRVKATFVN